MTTEAREAETKYCLSCSREVFLSPGSDPTCPVCSSPLVDPPLAPEDFKSTDNQPIA
jgi:hypothetical protein